MSALRVLIIGAGPAGLLAAWGADRETKGGALISLWDPDPSFRPDRIFSLQYMHELCDLPTRSDRSMGVRELKLSYKLDPPVQPRWFGNDREVRQKYNLKLGRPVDEDNSTKFLWESPVTVWSLKDAYEWLHRLYRSRMYTKHVWWDDFHHLSKIYDVVINTAPLDKLRPDLEWPVRYGAIALNWLPNAAQSADSCIYNVDPKVPWYRTTRLDGGDATEFIRDERLITEWFAANYDTGPDASLPSIYHLRKVKRGGKVPTEGLPTNVAFLGRWGSWDPDALTHHAYKAARELVRRTRA